MNWEVTKQVIGSLIRGLLYVVSSWLVARGWISQDLADAWLTEATGIILGVIIALIPIIWKILNARFNITALIKAVQTEPPADTPREIAKAVKQAQTAAKEESAVPNIVPVQL